MNDKYILDGHTPVLCEDVIAWGRWYEKADRHVAQTMLNDNVRVSTVFLGLDHNFGVDGPPLVFETMIFGGPEDQYCDRYSTWDEAEAGHARAVEKAKAALKAAPPAAAPR